MSDTFDYVVLGGGTAGPVVAGRLSEDPNTKILIIEAGQDSANMDNMHMAGAWTMNHQGETDWNITTPPQEGLHGRKCHLPRGRFLGGSSGCNGTICVRGVHQDYDDWEVDTFTGNEMFRAMKKAETFHPKKWFPHDEKAHGYDGPLHIEPGDVPPLADLFFKSYQSKGLPYKPDMFSNGEAANGCGHAMRTTWQGYRTTAADYLTKDRARPNVTIKCDSTVDKIIIEKGSDGKLVAKGAEFVDKNGNRHVAHAKKEVIVTGGTYCSPAILMRSGIGPKKELDRHNIPVLVDLPGVGQNLQDHQLIFTYYELNQALTDDARVNHDPNAYENGHAEWLAKKTGWLSTFPFGGFAFARLNDRLDRDVPEWKALPREPGRDPMGLTEKQPNMEFFHTVCYGGPPEYTDKPKEGQYALAMCNFLCGMQSRGEVLLNDTNPMTPPYVDHKYLSDKRDLMMMAEGCRYAKEVVMEGEGTKDVFKGAWPPGAKHHEFKTNEDWRAHVQKYTSTSYHPVGTCAIGQDFSKPGTVVNKYLQVKDVPNLRVVDCSVMPYVHSGHTQMPAYGIAELGAEFIQKGLYA